MSNIFSFISDSLKSNSSASTNSFASLFSSALNGNTANSTPALLPNTNTPVQINKKSIDLKSIGNFSTGKNETISKPSVSDTVAIKNNPATVNDTIAGYAQRTTDMTPKILADRQIQKEKDNANIPGLVSFFTSIPTETFKGLTRLPASIEQVFKSISDNIGGKDNAVSKYLQSNIDDFKQNYITQFGENPTTISEAVSSGYKQYGILGAVGLGSLEVLAEVPLLPESKEISTIAKTTDVNIIKSELVNIYKGADDKFINAIAEDLSKINTKKGVVDYLKNVNKDTKKIVDTVKTTEPIAQNIPDVVPDTSKTTDMFLHNVNRMNVSESAKNAIVDEMAPFKNNIENIIGKPMTFEEVANVAQKTSDTLSNTIGKETTIDLAAKARNTKDLIATIAQDGKITPDNLGKLYDAFSAIDTYGADLGRRLNDLKYGGNPMENSILDNLFKRIKDLGISKEGLTDAAKKFDLNTLEGQQQLFREFVKPNLENWLDTLRMNSMLSSPATYAANILSNFEGTGIIRPITKVIEGGVDTLHSLFTNTPRTRFSGEALPYLKGYYNPKTVSEAWGMAKDVLKGITDIKNVDIRDIPKADPKTVLGKIEKVLSVPMKALESMDVFFSHLASTGEKRALDYRKSLGVTIDKMSSLVAEERATKELFRNKIINESDGILSNGVAELASKLQSLQYSKNPLIRTIAKFTMPFVRTPVNILKSGIEHNPILGIPNLINAADKTEAVSKILLGSTIMGVGLNKALAGDITFSYPTDATQKENMQAMGIPEYSIRIGNNWYSYQKLHPAVAFNLATLGAFSQAIQEGKYSDSKASDAAKALLGGSLKFLANQSYLKSWGQFMDGMNGDEFSFQQFASNYPQQIIPFRALSSWANRMILTDQKTVSKDAGFFDKQLQLIMMQIPGLSETLPNKLDSNGNPMLNPDRVRPDNLTGIMAAIGQRTSPAPDNLIEDYKNYTNARLYKKAVADSQKTDKQVLDHFVSVFNQTKDPTVKKQLLSTVLSDNPQLLGKITDALTKKKRDLNAEEKQMDDMPIKDGTRARYIVARIKSITDPTEQKKFIANLIAKKILTPNVISSITQSKQGDIAPQITQ